MNDELFFGVDHLHFVERALGNKTAALARFSPTPAEPGKAKLTIYHDFASPWSYIGSTQVAYVITTNNRFGMPHKKTAINTSET